jgi:RNA 2',3'-cyclic 3'-phosphodiesterase
MRLFVAIDIPEDVRSAIGSLVAKLQDTCQNARWARIEGLHVTLKFIGETPAEKTEIIETALASVPCRASISLRFLGLGFFPNERRPRVLWAGVQGGKELAEVAAAVDAALQPFGIPREERAYTPHLTLARFDSPQGLDALRAAVEKTGPLEFGGGATKEFHLYQSVLKRGRAEYTRQATFSFAKTSAGTIWRRGPE